MGFNFDGTWTNKLGSSMDLEVDETTGIVSGEYRTAVGEPNPGEIFPIVGFVQGDLLAFCVNFDHHDSLAAWTGQATTENGRDVIRTLWHLANDVEDHLEPMNLWGSIRTGSNEFHRS